MKVDAVLYFNVVNPERAIIQVQDYLPATNMLAQTTLRAMLGQHAHLHRARPRSCGALRPPDHPTGGNRPAAWP